MPLTKVTAYVIACDICHDYLAGPDHPARPNTNDVASFVTPELARAVAAAAHWTVGRDLYACPKCSPFRPPSEPQTPCRDRAARGLDPDHPID